MDHPDDGSSSSSIGGCSGGGTSKSSVTVGGGTVSGSLNRLFMKPTSKSAPSSPPITTVTAASPEPPPIAPVPASGTICDSTAVAVTTSEATGSDSQFVKSSVSVSTSTTALQRLNNHSNNNNNTSGTSQQEQTAAPTPVTASASVPAATVTATATAAVFNRPYPASSPGSTPDHPATLSPTSPVSQRLGSGHTTTQYLGQHRSSMQYIQTPGAGGGGGGGVGGGGGITGRSVGDGPNSGTTGSVFISRRRGSSNAGPGDRGGSTSSMVGTSGTIRRKSREFVPGPIRRASQVLISLTSPDGASLYGECSRRDSRAVPQITLMSSTFQRLPMKDFGAEVRASMDVDQFLQQAVLLLDVNETSLEGIVDRIVKKVLDGREPLATIKEAKMVLFTHESVNLLARTIQGTYISEGGGFDYDQSWLCTMCALPSLQKRHVAIARLKHPANMGRNSHEVRFFIMVLTPSKEKGTKNAMETGRTFATIFADMDFRQKLLEIQSEAEFKAVLLKHAQDLAAEQSNPARRLGNHERSPNEMDDLEPKCHIAQGLCEDLRRRLSHYISDYVDGIVGRKTISKTISTIFFLYFACILPTVAFGVLNDNNTSGAIGDIRKAIIGQTVGGLFFGLFGGQPLVIIMTTAPLCLYAKVVFNICEDFDLNFHAMYACVGLWTSFFLIIYAAFDVSRLMKWCTRSTEEIFALFISIAFAVDAFRDVFKNFKNYYYSDACTGEGDNPLRRDPFLLLANATVNYTLSNLASNPSNVTSLTNLMKAGGSQMLNNSTGYPLYTSSSNTDLLNTTIKSVLMAAVDPTSDASSTVISSCRRDSSLLFLLLMLGTVWLAITLYNFNKTPYLQASKRELLADYALPVAVILLSFIGSYIFRDIPVDHFRYNEELIIERAHIEDLPASAAFASMGLGFALSLLIFMDQNIAEAMVNNPCNKLKKGCAYHLDLFVVGILNGFLSIYGFPWMHGVLPHSPLHLRSLADVEERVDGGHVYEIIVRVRETRITQIISHILIGLSIFLVPYPLAYIPTAVLDGLFLYMAITSLSGNQMFERITLLFMEQAAYPPNHYIRRCPQRKIHLFTLCQLTQLGIMCFFGFSPWAYVKMVFPVIILLLLPVRHKIVTYIIDNKYLDALDGEHQ